MSWLGVAMGVSQGEGQSNCFSASLGPPLHLKSWTQHDPWGKPAPGLALHQGPPGPPQPEKKSEGREPTLWG